MRVQRTRSSPSALRSPLTHHPLGVAGLAVAITLAMSCVRTTHIEQHSTDSGHEIDVMRRWHGVTLGSCGFVTGAYANYVINLEGEGPVYTIEQIEFVNEQGKPDTYLKDSLKGEVILDDSKRRVTIKLYRNGYPFEINGTYRYRTKSAA